MIHKACMPVYSVYMNSGKIVADGRDGTGGKIEGSTRGPRGPKNATDLTMKNVLTFNAAIIRPSIVLANM